uniref:PDZ domain-containing protein n=1 Tax=Parastrongyloides trichosuri TaxID=131310 RepID=A0A0N4Z6T0_PARTI
MVISAEVPRQGFKRFDIPVEKGKNVETLGVIIRQKNEYCVITKCESGSWASKYLKVEDTIIKIDGVIIANKEECVKQLQEVSKNKTNSLITVERPETIDAKIWTASVLNEESAFSAATKMVSTYNKTLTNSTITAPSSSIPISVSNSLTLKKASNTNTAYGCSNFNFGQDVKDIVSAELTRIKNGGLCVPTFSILKHDSFDRGQRKTFVNDIIGEIPIVPDLSKPSMRTVGKIYMGK